MSDNATSDQVTVACTATPAAQVVSISRRGAESTDAGTVQYVVAFSQAVSGLALSDFALAETGTVSGAQVSSVAPLGTSDAAYVVTVSGTSGAGSLGLNLRQSAGIVTAGNFTGETYIIGTAPVYNAVSAAGVRYGDGNVVLSTDELGLGVTRTYSAQVDTDQGIGYGWQLAASPYVTQTGSQVVVTLTQDDAYWFTANADGTYAPKSASSNA